MKIVLLLLVCLAASTQASQAGPLNQFVNQIENHVETVIQGLKDKVLALIQTHQPQINDLFNTVQTFVSALPAIKDRIVNKVKEIFAQFVQNFNQKDARQVAEVRIFGQLQDLVAQLNNLAGSIVQHFVDAATDAANKPKPQVKSDIVSAVLEVLQENIQTAAGQLSDKLQETIDKLQNLILGIGKRAIGDFVLNSLGLGAVWDEIKELGNGFVGQLMAIGTQLLFQGQAVWNNAKPILAQLVQDLTAHTGNAVDIVQGAIGQLTNVIANKPTKRDLMDTLGLSAVWDQIKELGFGVVAQFAQIGAELLFAGKQKWAEVQKVLAQLVSDLTSHTGSASQIVANAINQVQGVLKPQGSKRDWLSDLGLNSVWDQIKELGMGVVAQFVTIGTEMLFQGKQKWAEVQAVIAQLVADLTSHTGSASQIVQQAIDKIQQTIAGSTVQKRDLISDALNNMGLTAVWDQIKDLGMGVIAQFTVIAGELLFAGKQKLEEVKKIFAQLVADLTSHTGSASQIVANAINQVQGVLKPQGSKRGVADFVVNSLGLGQVWETIQQLGGNFSSQLMAIGTQLLFSGQQLFKEKIVPILTQLVSDLTNHVGDASQIVSNAISQINGVLKPTKRDLMDSLGLGAVWDQIKELGMGVVAQFAQIGAELLFAGQQKWAEVQKVLAQLVADLTSHTGSASQIVANAINQVQGVLKPPTA